MKKAFVTLMISLIVLSPTLAIATPVFAETALTTNNEIYVPDTYNSEEGIVPYERGRCTDSYSKEWCDSHGFANNRPVPHSVQLNAKEKKCLTSFYISAAGQILIAGVTLNPAGIYIGTPVAAFQLWNCLR